MSIEYLDLMEIVQGGPLAGTLSVNGRIIHNHRFGGPVLFYEKNIYAPVFIRRFCISGFKICRINVESLEISMIGKVRDLICLERISENRIYFFCDINKTKQSFYEI